MPSLCFFCLQALAESADTKAAVEVGVEAAPPLAQLNATAVDTSLFDKPGQLVSVQPENHEGLTHDGPGSPPEPYSGNSERLEISSVSACAAIKITQAAPASPCLENGVAAHNEPEENHYESPGPSLDVQEDVVQVLEEPSVLNMDGQEASEPQLTNGKPVTEVASALPQPSTIETVSSETPPSQENHHQSEATAEGAAEVQPQLQILQAAEQAASNHIVSSNTKYIVTAAGVGACALLMAWKFKH